MQEIVKASNKLLKKGFIKCNTLYGKGNMQNNCKVIIKITFITYKKINYI